jgi:hypothetical protein
MIYKENLETTGRLNITVFNGDGNIKNSIYVDNLVVTTGRDWLADRSISNPSAMSHMATGTGTTTQVLADTSLETELARVALVSSSRLDNTVTFAATFNAGVSTGALTEAGILNAATSGTMLCRTTFPVINLQAADSISITWTITIS